VTLVGFEDNRAAIAWQVQQLAREVCGLGQFEARIGSCAERLWEALVEALSEQVAVFAFKANLLPHRVPDFCASDFLTGVKLQAQAGSGIVWGYADNLTRADADRILKESRALAAADQGRVIVVRCPSEWKNTRFVWDVPRGDMALMRAVKENLDPRRLFNPGRFIDGI
jgi:glycolate oxidase FAD binding subunit